MSVVIDRDDYTDSRDVGAALAGSCLSKSITTGISRGLSMRLIMAAWRGQEVARDRKPGSLSRNWI